MEGTISIHASFFLLLLVFLLQCFSSTLAAPCPVLTQPTPRMDKNIKYIKSSCNTTLYPRLCYHSLSVYANTIQTNQKLLVHTALNITQKATKSTSRLVRKMARVRGLNPSEAAAMGDCIDEVGDSLYELARSIGEMGRTVKGGTRFDMLIADIQTWVSAALTDDATCLDGLDEVNMNRNVKAIVGRHVGRISRLTSNALALINNYASSLAIVAISVP